MTTRAMGMAMSDFFFCGVANINDFDGKLQGASGKRMVGVDIDGLEPHLDNAGLADTIFGADFYHGSWLEPAFNGLLSRQANML